MVDNFTGIQFGTKPSRYSKVLNKRAYSIILNNRLDLNKRVDGKIHIMKLTESKIFEYLVLQAASPCIRDAISVIF